MKLSTYAKQLGITWRSAYNHFKAGQIPGAYVLPSGTIIVPDATVITKSEWTIVYARVSTPDKRNTDLQTQAERLSQFCTAKGWIVNEIVKEVASGLNDHRPKLQKILKERKATRLVVEHKDRLTRFGFEYIKTLFNDCEITVVNESENNRNDLMQDFVSVITSFCARLYGQRRTKRQTENLIEKLNENNTK